VSDWIWGREKGRDLVNRRGKTHVNYRESSTSEEKNKKRKGTRILYKNNTSERRKVMNKK